jgi:hypothetical protein
MLDGMQKETLTFFSSENLFFYTLHSHTSGVSPDSTEKEHSH